MLMPLSPVALHFYPPSSSDDDVDSFFTEKPLPEDWCSFTSDSFDGAPVSNDASHTN